MYVSMCHVMCVCMSHTHVCICASCLYVCTCDTIYLCDTHTCEQCMWATHSQHGSVTRTVVEGRAFSWRHPPQTTSRCVCVYVCVCVCCERMGIGAMSCVYARVYSYL